MRDGIKGMLRIRRGIILMVEKCIVCGKRRDLHTEIELELCVIEMSDSIRKERELLK